MSKRLYFTKEEKVAAQKASVVRYREANREKLRLRKNVYDEANREVINAKARERFACNRETERARQKVWRDANKEYIKTRNDTWRTANPVKVIEYRENGKERAKVVNKAWREANPEKQKEIVRQTNARRRARITGVTATLTIREWQEVWEEYGGLCFWCGDLGEQMDHIVPLLPKPGQIQGHHTKGNVVPACASCNHSKWNNDPLTWLFQQKAKVVILG